MSSLNTVLQHARSGKLRILAVTSRNRSASAPDIPTFRESGLPELANYEVEVYYGLMARAGTPKEALARIAADARRVMAMPEVVQRVGAGGLDLFVRSPEEMAAIMSADVEKFRKVIEYAGIRPE